MNARLGTGLALLVATSAFSSPATADMSVLSQTFKPVTFDSACSLSGTLSGKYGNQPVNGKFTGSIRFTGGLTYTAPDAASGQFLGLGSLDASIYGYGALPTVQFDADTGVGGAEDVAGRFSARFPAQTTLSATEFTGAIDTKTFEGSGRVTFKLEGTVVGSGSWKATLAPSTASPLSVATTLSWASPGVMDVGVVADGSVQPADTLTTPVATVSFYWGSSTGTRMTKLVDTIPIGWNQASGHYQLSNLPTAPADAISLIAVTRYGTTSKSKKLLLPVP